MAAQLRLVTTPTAYRYIVKVAPNDERTFAFGKEAPMTGTGKAQNSTTMRRMSKTEYLAGCREFIKAQLALEAALELALTSV